jgi:hypothetical protein
MTPGTTRISVRSGRKPVRRISIRRVPDASANSVRDAPRTSATPARRPSIQTSAPAGSISVCCYPTLDAAGLPGIAGVMRGAGAVEYQNLGGGSAATGGGGAGASPGGTPGEAAASMGT